MISICNCIFSQFYSIISPYTGGDCGSAEGVEQSAFMGWLAQYKNRMEVLEAQE